jgi:hypothetical protein
MEAVDDCGRRTKLSWLYSLLSLFVGLDLEQMGMFPLAIVELEMM